VFAGPANASNEHRETAREFARDPEHPPFSPRKKPEHWRAGL
jgi:hypothetical protein